MENDTERTNGGWYSIDIDESPDEYAKALDAYEHGLGFSIINKTYLIASITYESVSDSRRVILHLD